MSRIITYAQALNEALAYCMEKDDSVFIMGEDVGRYGGIFQVTAGLQERFGVDRVMDTPISEAAFVGGAVGAAMTGMRPVVEIMFIDFITVAMDMVVNQMAKMHFMFGGRAKVPMVIRVNIGAGRGTAAQHSQSFHAIFQHIPGIKIAMPATPHDAKGMLIEAIQDDNPVLFVEHKKMYIDKGEVPEEAYTVPIGKAKVVRPGKDLTVVATLNMVAKALAVAEELAAQGVDMEVIDLRSLCPLDREAVLASVRKTGALITADEGCHTGNMGGELAATVAEQALDSLKAPIIRVAGPDTPVAFSPPLEQAFIPSEQDIKDAVARVLEYL